MKKILLIIGFIFSLGIYMNAQEQDRFVYIIDDSMPIFPGGEEKMMKFIGDNLKYPSLEGNIQGKVVVSFNIKADGTIDSVKIAKGLHPRFDEEAIRVVKLMPKWIPAKPNLNQKDTPMTLPFVFRIKNETIKVKDFSSDSILYEPEVMPQFPEGEAAMMDFIAKNLRYPIIQQCEIPPVQGRVIVRFRITKTGKIDNISILKGLEDRFDQEAIRLVKSMPKWNPGKQNGENVDVYFTLPILFRYK